MTLPTHKCPYYSDDCTSCKPLPEPTNETWPEKCNRKTKEIEATGTPLQRFVHRYTWVMDSEHSCCFDWEKEQEWFNNLISEERKRAQEEVVKEILEGVEYNKHNLGEFGEFIRVEYIKNIVLQHALSLGLTIKD